MASLAEYFQAFHSYAYENTLTASARALYYTILGEFNNAYWKRSEMSKSVRELRDIGGFKSESIVQRAKAQLGNENILQISKNKNGDTYRLVEPSEWKNFKKPIGTDEERVRNTCGTDEEQMRNTCGTPSGFLNNAHAEDIKDSKDRKTKTNQNENARAIPKIKDTSVEEIDSEVRHAWILANGENPFGGYAEDLLALQKSYGAKKVADAITSCRRKRTFGDMVSINFVKAELLKGGESSGKIIPIRTGGERNLANGIWQNRPAPKSAS